MNPFHLAIPVQNLNNCLPFYLKMLGCSEGRSDRHWVDLDLYGHQLVLHEKADHVIPQATASNPVDGHAVPVPHFGVVLPWDEWQSLSKRLRDSNVKFVIEPYIRFEGEVGEQATMFLMDPENNALEFKAFRNIDQLFAK